MRRGHDKKDGDEKMNEKEMEDIVLNMREIEEFVQSENVKTLIKDINNSGELKKKLITSLFMKVMADTKLTKEEVIAMLETLKFMSLLDVFEFTKTALFDMIERLETGRLAKEDLGLR